MDLKILLPYKIFSEDTNVTEVIVDTNRGSFGFLPQRLDCIAVLVPGILSYKNQNGGWKYVAIDEGVFMKTDQQILVTVRNAIGGADLGTLRESIDKEFKNLDEKEIKTRSVIAKLESEFMQKIKRLHQDQS